MAVPVYRRSVSKKEYLYNFKKLRKGILSLVLRDFDIKSDNYPEWLIQLKREEILKSLSLIAAYINRASAVYPQTEVEKKEQVILQNRAIQECFVLYDILEDCSVTFSVINGNYTLFAKMIKDEITYLKYWKKCTNKIKVSL